MVPSLGFAQTNAIGQFGCGERQRAALNRTELKFVELVSPDAVNQWKTRPVLAFDGFDAAKYGFTRVEFYRWHMPVPGRQGYDQGVMSSSTDRLALAVRLVGLSGQHWFELATPGDPAEDLLYIQLRDDNESNGNPTQPASSTAKRDEMSAWLDLHAATPDAKLPLFSLSYWHQESGMYQVETFDTSLLVDLRTSSPKIISALSCSEFEPIGGACSAQDQAYSGSDDLECQWDAAAADFRCTMTSPYGGANAARTAEKDFYLLSNKPAKASIDHAEFLSDIGQFALRIRENPNTPTKGILVTGLGPVTLLQRFKDLLPDADVFVFASPGAGGVWNTHLSLVTVSSAGKTNIQSISKWGISGEETDESEAPRDLVPLTAQDSYHTHMMEQRAGFRAFDAALTAMPGQPDLGHVLYWIGLEAVDGELAASAVRLASDGYAYGGCGQEFHEGTATSIRRKTGLAEATLRVQGQFNYELTNPYPTEGPNCVWTSLLHWKPGAGFRSRKLAEDCSASHREVKISDNGEVTSRAAPQSP